MKGSKVYQQNRAIGYVSNNVPATVRYLFGRKDNLITTCVGKSFQTFTSNHFRLLSVSGLHPEDITCLASNKLLIFSACGSTIYAWRAGSEIRFKYLGHKSKVHLMMTFGQHLLSVDEDSSLRIWEIKTEVMYLEIPFQNDQFKITAMMHPDTYVNKILLGSEQGGLQLWNIRQGKLVYSFKNKFDSRVTTLEQSPALDVIGVGLNSGKIVLFNLKLDEIVMEFFQDWGPVTGLSFRTDGPTIMVSSSVNGQVAFWNLEDRKIAGTLTAHTDSVVTLKCLPSEPLLLTTSSDNSMKLWIFDKSDGGPRLLRIREGHSAPPLSIRFHGSAGVHILSAGEDSSMRIFSTISESLNQSLGRASYNRKASKKKTAMEEDPLLMPPIVQFTSETTREKEWDSIAAIHQNLVITTTWSFDKKKMGDLRLVPKQFQNKNKNKDFRAIATCLVLTHCGNFVIIGYSSGDVERFNVQSGLHRASYGKPAHDDDVRGVFSDNLNQVVITGAMDGMIKFWNFKNDVENSIGYIKMPDSILMFRGHRESSMLCVILENFTAQIVDYDTKCVIRKFSGHTAGITDACFSPDSRWLITASMDCTIKTWDIPSSYMIDHFKMSQPCISLAMSPAGNYLATAHVDFLGIYLWANKTLYENIPLRSVDPLSEAPMLELPSLAYFESLEGDLERIKLEDDDDEDGELIKIEYKTPGQIDPQLITLSNLAESKWRNLLNLELIKKRNKPKEPLKKPKQAPFFLPTVAGLDMKFDLEGAEIQEESKILKSQVENLTMFGSVLKKSRGLENYEASIQHITNLNPSMIDFEIKSLAPMNGGSIELMLDFMKMIVEMFKSKMNFELAQSYLALFLKLHEQLVIENSQLVQFLDTVEAAQNKSWNLLENQLLYGIGVVSNLRNFC